MSNEIEHLRATLAMIAGRTAFAGAVSLIPVPILDEWLAGRAREALLERIAEIRQVDVDSAAIVLLADVGDESLDHAIGAAEAASLFRGAFRRIFRTATSALKVARYGDEAVTTFTVATLFDHYCARHHLGAGVDLARARRLRSTIDGAVSDARFALARRAVRRASRAGRGLLLAAPRRLGLAAPESTSLAPTDIDRATGPLPAAARAWLEELTRAFDRRWSSQEHE
jgi:hypothetical protein